MDDQLNSRKSLKIFLLKGFGLRETHVQMWKNSSVNQKKAHLNSIERATCLLYWLAYVCAAETMLTIGNQ